MDRCGSAECPQEIFVGCLMAVNKTPMLGAESLRVIVFLSANKKFLVDIDIGVFLIHRDLATGQIVSYGTRYVPAPISRIEILIAIFRAGLTNVSPRPILGYPFIIHWPRPREVMILSIPLERLS
jgi:hypothetical protein